MAKAIQYVIELNKYQAKKFLEDILNPKPNPARDETIKRAKELEIEIK
ncbi:MAG TPA: hypothetical protein VI912_03285 [Candidatus Bilamarchaeaceae archaeon]|nr:hypothetical protein [Candidatus Bilamarchaeaceae archaeon]